MSTARAGKREKVHGLTPPPVRDANPPADGFSPCMAAVRPLRPLEAAFPVHRPMLTCSSPPREGGREGGQGEGRPRGKEREGGGDTERDRRSKSKQFSRHTTPPPPRPPAPPPAPPRFPFLLILSHERTEPQSHARALGTSLSFVYTHLVSVARMATPGLSQRRCRWVARGL